VLAIEGAFARSHIAAKNVWVASEERTLPANAPTLAWQMITGRFQDVLHQANPRSSDPAFFLE